MRPIRLRRLPVEHALLAKKGKFYIEAIQVLHAHIEMSLRDLLLLDGSNRRAGSTRWRKDYGLSWDVSNEIGYTAAVAASYVLGLISHSMFMRLRTFNSVRNTLIHRLMLSHYDKDYEGLPYKKFSNAFTSGIQLADRLDSLIEKTMQAAKPARKLP